MTLLSKIVWSEGMHLAPQHFQAQNRYFENSIHFACSNLWSESYGFTALQIDKDAVRNGTLALVHARGLFPDGLAFDIPESDSLPGPCNFADAFSPAADHLTVYLAVPRWSAEGQNCELNGALSSGARYIGDVRGFHDENTGRDEKQVWLGRKNIRLILNNESTGDLLTLAAARIIRDGRGQFILDPAFVAPCLKISASDRLLEILGRLLGILEEKSTWVTRDSSNHGKFATGVSTRQVWQFWLLHAVNSGLTPLRHMLLSKHWHPEQLFREMLHLGGALCTFDLETHPRLLPAYDHLHLGKCFQQLDDQIRRLLEVVVPSQTVAISLTQRARYFHEGQIEDTRCFHRGRWILGIHSSIGEADLIRRAQDLTKICSAKFVPELVKRAMPGLTLTHLPVPPSAVVPKVEYQYFSISRSGPCWEHIMQSKAVGVYVPAEIADPEVELIAILENPQ